MGSIEDVKNRILENYIGEIDEKTLEKAAIEGMLQKLDSYSRLVEKDDLELQNKTKSNIVYRISNKEALYIRIKSFYNCLEKEMKECIIYFKENNLKYVILDLRNNPGGNVENLQQIASYFISEGKYLKLQFKNKSIEYYSEGKIFYENISVIVNNNTLSCAEILAGAMQDADNRVLVGEQTRGKNSAQCCYKIDKQYWMMLSSAYYSFRHDRKVSNKGIVPNIQVPRYSDELEREKNNRLDVNIFHRKGDVHSNISVLQRRLKVLGLKLKDKEGLLGEDTIKAFNKYSQCTRRISIKDTISEKDLSDFEKFFFDIIESDFYDLQIEYSKKYCVEK